MTIFNDLLSRYPEISNLPSLNSLFSQINKDMGNSDIWVLLVVAGLLLAMHGIVVLMIAATFHWLSNKLVNKRVYGANFVSYFIAILLIIVSHLSEIITWSYVCMALQVFPGNPQTFYFAGEMYTTVGYGNYILAERWRILPIIISFSGIFSVSMSGAALYTMLGALLSRAGKNPKADSEL